VRAIFDRLRDVGIGLTTRARIQLIVPLNKLMRTSSDFNAVIHKPLRGLYEALVDCDHVARRGAAKGPPYRTQRLTESLDIPT
jgi:hypothetical protein